MRQRVIVVGSGVAGASAAFALSRRGVSVTLVDAADTGAATDAGAGIIQPWSSATEGAVADLHIRAAEHYPDLLQQLTEDGIDEVAYRRTGSLVVHRDPDRLTEVAQRVRRRGQHSPMAGTVEGVDAAGARRLFPALSPELSGLFIPGGARVDGRTLRAGLIHAARRQHTTVIGGRARLACRGSSVSGVVVDDTAIEADAVLVAAGVWVNSVLQPLGNRLPLEPQRGQIVHLHPQQANTARWPTVHPLTGHYMVAFDDSRVVVGATRETGSGFDVRVTAAGQREVLTEALTVAPGLADASVVETRVGLRPASEDGLPHVGPVDGVSGLYVDAGFGASGLTLGPYVGELLAQTICGGRTVDGLTPFLPRVHTTTAAD